MKKIYVLKFCLFLCAITSLYGQIDPQDKNVLISLYNATDGSNWSSTWDLSGDGTNWHGVTLDSDGKVTVLNLNFNNLTGVLPSELANLDKLTTLAVGGNNLSGQLPNLSGLTNLQGLGISNNSFKFEDFEDQFTQLSGLSSFYYEPQNPICPSVITELISGERKRLVAGSDSSANIYRWTKNGVDISGATDQTYTINAMSAADEGIYECFITNSTVTGLELSQGKNRVVLSNNLIKNASFEDWFEFFGRNNLTNWYAGIESNNTLTNLTQVEDATRGKYAVQAQTNRVNADGKNFGRLVIDSNHRFTLESGKTYQITFDYKVASGNITGITTRFIDGGLIENTDELLTIQNNGWQSHLYTFTATSTSEFYDFEITFESDTNTAELILDNLSIIEQSNVRPNVTKLDEYYTFSETSGTYVPLVEGDADRVVVPSNYTFYNGSIPFDFVYAGQSASLYRFVSDPGIVFFGSTSGVITTDLSEIGKDIITPLMDRTTIGTDTKILYKTTGTAPNRIHILEYKNAHWSDDDTKGTVNVQIHLEETTNSISFVYGPSTPDASSQKTTSIGLAADFGEESSAFISVTPGSPATVSSTQVDQGITWSQFPSEGTIYKFSYMGEEQCQKPLNVSTRETRSTTEMQISWSKPAFSDKNTVYVTKTTQSSDTLSFITKENNFLVTGLEPNTSYYTWVVNNCSAEQSSVRSQVAYFSTPPLCRAPLYPSNRDIQKNSIMIDWETNGGETMWDVAILLESENRYEPEESEITTINLSQHTFNSLIEDTEYRVFYRANCGQGEVSRWNYQSYITLSDCPRPRELRSEVTTSTTADISWTARGSETSWEVVVQEEGLGEPTTAGVIVTSPNYQVTGIDNTKIFVYYVRAVCSATENSAWSRKVITEELQSERDILIAFYNATDGPNTNLSNNSNNWNSDKPISTWYGVTVRDGRVISINLSHIGLSGSLPEELFDLSALENLNLAFNSLNGEVSTSISKLEKLETLSLRYNSFSGSIPAEIGELIKLKSIDLSFNSFQGVLPESIGNLVELESLSLQSENANAIPTSYANLVKLRQLSIRSSNLQGTIPTFLGQLSNLNKLELINNQLEGGIPQEILSLPNIYDLSLWRNNLMGNIADNIPVNHNTIEYLRLDSNNFTGSIPKEINTLPNLSWLDFSQNELEGAIPAEITELSNLERLHLSSNNLSGLIPEGLANLASLERLFIEFNSYTFKDLETFLALNPSFDDFFYSYQSIDPNEIVLDQLTGDAITLSSDLEGANNKYQWYKNGGMIEGATAKTFQIENLTLSDRGQYSCLVSNTVITGYTLVDKAYTLNIEILDLDNDGVDDNVDQCLNTSPGTVVDENGCEIFTLPANNFTVEITGESCRTSDNGAVKVTSLNTNYEMKATLLRNNDVSINEIIFTGTVTIENLAAGTYDLCLTIASEPSFKQCFAINIEEPDPLGVFPKIDRASKIAILELSGAKTYFIEINGLKFSTTDTEVQIPLDQNKNVIKVFTDKDCQGTFEKTIYMNEDVRIYPNPFVDVLNINLGLHNEKETKVTVYNTSGFKVYSNSYKSNSDDVTIDTSSFSSGVYIINVINDEGQRNYKIIKR